MDCFVDSEFTQKIKNGITSKMFAFIFYQISFYNKVSFVDGLDIYKRFIVLKIVFSIWAI